MLTRKPRRVALVAAAALVVGLVGSAPGALAIVAGFSPSPASLDYGDVASGAGHADLTVTLTNQDVASHSVSATAVSGANAADFSITSDTCSGTSVPAAGTCAIDVRFAPASTGARSGSLDVTTDDSVGTHQIALSGNGIGGLTVPALLDYGVVTVFDPGVSLDATLTNGGATTFSITGNAISGANAADFAITAGTCAGASLATSDSCSVTVRFTPSAVGVREAVLDLTGPVPFTTVSIPLIGSGGAPDSPVAWGATRAAGPAYTWTWGANLARTVQKGTQRLHLAYATDRVGGKWVRDKGPFLGVYYVKSTTGATWTTPKRLNPSTMHAERPAIASAGARVYAAYVSQTKWINFSPTAARVLYVRVNTSHGNAKKWLAPVRLSSKTGRVDFPTIAATGSDVYVAYTAGASGGINLAISHNGGGAWSTKAIGTTTWLGTDGYEGVPVVSVSGSTVAVAWTSNDSGAVAIRVSADKGATWGPVEELRPQSTSTVSVAVRGNRIGVAWTDAVDGVMAQVRVNGTWADPTVVAPLSGNQYGPVVVLQDPSRLGVTWAQAGGDLADLWWAESSSNGAAWYLPQVVGSSGGPTHATNDWPSALWPSAGTRLVAWNGWTPGTIDYRMYLRTGTGTPAGLSRVAGVASAPGTPAAGTVSIHPSTVVRERR